MMLIVIFLIIFGVGPLIFRFLTQRAPSANGARRLAVFAFSCAAIALAIRYGVARRWGADVVNTGVGIMFIWLEWIGVLAFGTQALRRADPGILMRRWTAVFGSMATTIPWFGLIWASYITT